MCCPICGSWVDERLDLVGGPNQHRCAARSLAGIDSAHTRANNQEHELSTPEPWYMTYSDRIAAGNNFMMGLW